LTFFLYNISHTIPTPLIVSTGSRVRIENDQLETQELEHWSAVYTYVILYITEYLYM